ATPFLHPLPTPVSLVAHSCLSLTPLLRLSLSPTGRICLSPSKTKAPCAGPSSAADNAVVAVTRESKTHSHRLLLRHLKGAARPAPPPPSLPHSLFSLQ
ncbi:unnamed protein product, partial [Closterium sp. NIES-54]